jgi:hypothetical protein
MEYPRFLVLEANSYDEDGYPIAAAWSLGEGTLKSVLVRPEDDWHEWDASNEDRHSITREQIEIMGESVLDLLREMSDDFEKVPVYVESTYLSEIWLNRMYEAYGAELPFEIYPVTDAFTGFDEHALEQELQVLADNLFLDLRIPEEKVRLYLELYHRLTNASLV